MDDDRHPMRQTINGIADALHQIAADLRETAKLMETGGTIIATPRVIKAAKQLDDISSRITRYDRQRYFAVRKANAPRREMERLRHKIAKAGKRIQTEKDGSYSILDMTTGNLLQSGLRMEDLAAIADEEDCKC